MTFAWQGLQLEHPKDWAPVALSGNRKEGYVRISSPDKGFLQLRWRRDTRGIEEETVTRYLAKIESQARKTKTAYSGTHRRSGGRICYSYKAGVSAKGFLLEAAQQRGAIFIEAVDTSPSVLKTAQESFLVQDQPLERWCLHGLDILVPSGLEHHSHELKAGKTLIQLAGPKMRVVAERWGFAEMLLQNKSLADWVKALSGLDRAEIECFPSKVSLYQKRSFLAHTWIKAVAQENLNQISLIRVESRKPELQPQWNWFAQ